MVPVIRLTSGPAGRPEPERMTGPGCRFCKAWYFNEEKVQVQWSRQPQFTLCCSHGLAAHVPPLPDPPEPLRELLCSSAESLQKNRALRRRVEHFQDNIRKYNTAMGFMSFGKEGPPTSEKMPPGGRGPWTYVLHGQAYHRISTLYPAENKAPRFGQIYIYDPIEAAGHRKR